MINAKGIRDMPLIKIVHSKGDPWKAASMFFGSDQRRKEAERKRAYADKCREQALKAAAEAALLDAAAEADEKWLAEQMVYPGEIPGNSGV